ncbi:E3 ubiquitin-protein ligase ATL9 [Brachypodium distachyon]|uniref:RING-type E3 ubiquitin transferase n=1 Tax=Brachypodium distachyon TaxID=15368 RepID=I1GY63_BRADI|nr:E3 ubiquitin-protein ligase ATL9 [Brachypodium distachyon]KQK18072.1 hypothetical protein BRADI_1g38420v3 [Brachypodium distachyon]|eukprot:XP_010229827.1 E3 ubiquitin-protein ligase ATL9 [Brachypodium distachyon]
MAQYYWPPGFPYNFIPPPPPPSNIEPESSSHGRLVAGLVIGFVASLLLFTVFWSLSKGHRRSRTAQARAARAAAPLPREGDDERQVRLRRASAASPAARLPAFTYSPSVKHNVAGGGGEEAPSTCSVCLGAFQVGETVRLLPACLHLHHVECIDPWLDAHSTCPLCRSDTQPAVDVAPRPPV